jgi:adenylate cyclase
MSIIAASWNSVGYIFDLACAAGASIGEADRTQILGRSLWRLDEQDALQQRTAIRIGFRTSIITVFVAVVLFVGLTLVYLSFERVSSMTRTAAGTFIDKVAQLGAARIDSQFKNVRDSLDILGGLPSIQSAEIDDNAKLCPLMAAMLRNNPQLFNLYVGYEDGSFLEMDVIDRAKSAFRSSLNTSEDAGFRLVVILRTGAAAAGPLTMFLSDNLISIAEVPGPANYDPRRRPWYVDAFKDEETLVTGPYIFFATGRHGYTLRVPLKEGRRGVVAGDILLDQSEEMLRQQLGQSGLAFLFNDAGKIVAHPQMRDLMGDLGDRGGELPTLDEIKLSGLLPAIQTWRQDGEPHQFFTDKTVNGFPPAI